MASIQEQLKHIRSANDEWQDEHHRSVTFFFPGPPLLPREIPDPPFADSSASSPNSRAGPLQTLKASPLLPSPKRPPLARSRKRVALALNRLPPRGSTQAVDGLGHGAPRVSGCFGLDYSTVSLCLILIHSLLFCPVASLYVIIAPRIPYSYGRACLAIPV